jgi:hypothetical protein
MQQHDGVTITLGADEALHVTCSEESARATMSFDNITSWTLARLASSVEPARTGVKELTVIGHLNPTLETFSASSTRACSLCS